MRKYMALPALVINRNGKQFVEAELNEIEPKEQIDDSVFGKP